MQHGLSSDLHDAKYQLAKRPARASLEHIKDYHLASPMTTKKNRKLRRQDKTVDDNVLLLVGARCHTEQSCKPGDTDLCGMENLILTNDAYL